MSEIYASGQEPGIAWSGISDKRSYYRLFAGYVIALLATGIATVALAMLAFDLAGDESGAVIGTALSIKMLAYVLAAPVLTVLTERLPRKGLLIALDLLRGGSLVLLPFVTQVWQIYALVFVFAIASATFSFVYLAIVPYLLGSEEDYTRSLSRSRIAGELEGPLSPLLAAGILLVMTPRAAFIVTAGAFLLSAVLVKWARLPQRVAARQASLWAKLMQGPKAFVSVPAFRAVIALDIAVALATAMVMVNTVVIVQGGFHEGRASSAYAFFAFGLGSVLAAVLLPPVLARVEDRLVMLVGLAMLVLGLGIGAVQYTLNGLLALWFGLGFGVAWAITPATYLIRRRSPPADLQVLVAAQMSIANGFLLLAYSLAGWLGVELGIRPTFLILAILSGMATLAFVRLWPAAEPAG